MQGLTIRPSGDADVHLTHPLFLLHWGEPWTLDQYIERRQRWAHRTRYEFVAEVDGAVVGWIESTAARVEERHWLRLGVAPEFQGKGVGSALLNHLRGELKGVLSIATDYKDDSAACQAFADKHGFEKKNHIFESELDLPGFDFEPWQFAVERLKATGLRICTMADFGGSEESQYKFWELEHITDHDIPGVDPIYLLDWEDAKNIIFKASHYNPAGEYLALDGDRFIGLSGVGETAPGRFYNQHTCVLKEYRGQGIALGLKILALQFAQSQGGKVCVTNNDSNNAPMLAINRKLGYRPCPGHYECTLTF